MKPFLEHVALADQQSVLAFRHDQVNFETPWHFHPQHELTYIEESIGTKFVGDYVGPYQPGELVLVRSFLPHCWKNMEKEHERAISTVVQWNDGVIPILPEMSDIFKMMNTSSKGIRFNNEDIASLVPSILRLPSLSSAKLIVQLLDLFHQLSHCDYVTLSAASFKSSISSVSGKRMALTHEFVATNFNRKIKLMELAKLLNMSEQSFARFFTKMMGRSFFKFLAEYRINTACRMLIDTDWPVSRIGYECGYDSIPFFYKQFKQLKGHSPLQLRLKHVR